MSWWSWSARPVIVNATVIQYTSSVNGVSLPTDYPHGRVTSRRHSTVSSDWLPSYIKATKLLLKIFKMAEYFPDRPHTSILFLGLLALSRKAPKVRPPARPSFRLPSARISSAPTRWISVKFYIVDIQKNLFRNSKFCYNRAEILSTINENLLGSFITVGNIKLL